MSKKKVLETAHDLPSSDHLGLLKTKNRIITHFTQSRILKDIRVYCKTCDECQRVDKTDLKTWAQMIKPPIIDKVFSGISADMMGPLPQRKNTDNHFRIYGTLLTLVIYCCYSRSYGANCSQRNIEIFPVICYV